MVGKKLVEKRFRVDIPIFVSFQRPSFLPLLYHFIIVIPRSSQPRGLLFHLCFRHVFPGGKGLETGQRRRVQGPEVSESMYKGIRREEREHGLGEEIV